MNNLIRRSLFNQINLNLNRAGQKHRLSLGIARSGNEEGPLHDLPDFHYANGDLAAPTNKQKKWIRSRANEAKILEEIKSEVESERYKVINAIKNLEDNSINKSIQNKKQKKMQKDALFEKKN
ncbi:hypothetical protein ACTA71_005793 [Dictyostelium dimigraforme]